MAAGGISHVPVDRRLSTLYYYLLIIIFYYQTLRKAPGGRGASARRRRVLHDSRTGRCRNIAYDIASSARHRIGSDSGDPNPRSPRL
eukprot:scaffold18163_cov133-Isochrysis_galbana.AAC.2